MSRLNKVLMVILISCFCIYFLDASGVYSFNNIKEKVFNNADNVWINENNSVTKNRELATIYQEFITNGGEFGSIDYAQYYLYDINKDGQEELIIFAGTNSKDAVSIVYSHVNNEVIEIGRLYGEFSFMCAGLKNDGLIIHYVENNMETLTEVKMVNNELIKKIIIPDYDFSKYVHIGECNPLVGFRLKDMSAFPEEYIIQASNNLEENINKNIIALNSPAIGTSLEDLATDYKYRGYTASYTNASMYKHNNPKYNLNLTGSIKYYWLNIGNRYIEYISRDGIIVDVRSTANNYDNVYQLLYGLNFSELLEYEPQIIYDNAQNMVQYLQWEIEDAYFSIEAMRNSNDWKNCKPISYCVYCKD